MAWEWSHTQEAYDYVKDQLGRLSEEQLIEIFSEWHVHELDEKIKQLESDLCSDYDVSCDITYDNERAFEAGKDAARHIVEMQCKDDLAEVIWDKASEHRTCDNGGWNAYVCPHGCHTVPFGPEED